MKRINEYEITSATGQLLYTSPHRDLAQRWARKHAALYPGLRLDAVERIEIRRRVWTDRAHLRVVA